MKPTHRVRRCDGNKAAWLLVRLDRTGEEMHSYGASTTAMSLDSLFAHAGHLQPGPADRVDFHWTKAPNN